MNKEWDEMVVKGKEDLHLLKAAKEHVLDKDFRPSESRKDLSCTARQ